MFLCLMVLLATLGSQGFQNKYVVIYYYEQAVVLWSDIYISKLWFCYAVQLVIDQLTESLGMLLFY